jgi:hypothetical protein
MLPPIFNLNLSSTSGIVKCSALHAICGLCKQYCSGDLNQTNTLFVLLECSVFTEIHESKGLFHVTGI